MKRVTQPRALAVILLLSVGCRGDPLPPQFVVQPQPPTAEVDLDATYIQRLPAIDYVWGSAYPDREGWPAVGQQVTWRAHVRNRAQDPQANVGYVWRLDGNVVQRGTLSLEALGEGTVDLPWSWTFDRHTLTFEIDDAGAIAETEEKNNSITVATDALSIAYHVERGMYEYFLSQQRALNVGSNSFEDFAQRQVRIWNQLAERAIGPLTPDGILDRLRVDAIHVVADGSIHAYTSPDPDDRSVDLQWGYTNAFRIGPGGLFNDFTESRDPNMTNPFYWDGVVMHELGHARYLTDLYAYDVRDDGAAQVIDIQEDGRRVAGSKYMPKDGTRVFAAAQGMMNSDYTRFDLFSAAALNRIHGFRARKNNFNPAGDMGVFLDDLPASNRITVRDSAGHPLANAEVSFFRHTTGIEYYPRYYDSIADITATSDANGQVLLGRDPAEVRERFRLPTGEFTTQLRPAVIIVRVATHGKVGYGFLPAYRFNEEYWAGHTTLGDVSVVVQPR